MATDTLSGVKGKMSRILFWPIRPSSEFGHAQMIIDLMDPSNYNNNYYKDRFLGNMYRIVSCQSVNLISRFANVQFRLLQVRCCGADGWEDYPNLFGYAPPEECVRWRSAGGRSARISRMKE